ncbi:hypothetical protein [Streptomyces sp. NPDC048650]|uniref:Rv1733c family protein n=1 Tax=unclassified Streptomyces TaxID=2593676 RepID=UPI0037168517
MSVWNIRRPWQHGPLWRGTDAAESWMVIVTGLLIAVLAPTAGGVAAASVDAASPLRTQQWRAVSAVVAHAPPAAIGTGSGDGTIGRARATVRWTARDGTVRTGETTVPAGVHAGDRTTAWLNRHGSLVPDPVSPVDSLAASIAVGTVAASATGLVLVGTERAGAAVLRRRRYTQWEKEWADMDAHWRHPQK